MKVTVVPIVIGALKTSRKGFERGRYNVLLGSARTLRSVLETS